MNKKRDYYEILGIDKSASASEIKQAFRRLARKYHPDVSEEANAREKFKEINEAYQILSNPDKRARYDQFGHSGLGANGFSNQNFHDFDFADIFGDFSGFFSGQGFGKRNQNQQAVYAMKVKFMEAMHGVSKNFKIETERFCGQCDGKGAVKESDLSTCRFCEGQGEINIENNSMFGMIFNQRRKCRECAGEGVKILNKCSECRGQKTFKQKETIEINVPKGIKTRQYIEISKFGAINKKTREQQPIICQFEVMPHSAIRQIEENHLFSEVPINFVQALVGQDILVPTIDGVKKVALKPLTTHKKIIRLKNFGAYDPNNEKKRGDHYFQLNIVWPEKMSREMKEYISKISEKDAGEVNQKFINDLKKRNLI